MCRSNRPYQLPPKRFQALRALHAQGIAVVVARACGRTFVQLFRTMVVRCSRTYLRVPREDRNEHQRKRG